jgi:hypothetical protein
MKWYEAVRIAEEVKILYEHAETLCYTDTASLALNFSFLCVRKETPCDWVNPQSRSSSECLRIPKLRTISLSEEARDLHMKSGKGLMIHLRPFMYCNARCFPYLSGCNSVSQPGLRKTSLRVPLEIVK